MLRDTAVDLILSRMTRTGNSNLKDSIIQEMVLVQETILEGGNFRPWFLVSEMSTATTTADEERLQLPSNFLEEWEEGTLYRYDSSNSDDPYVDLIKDDYDYLKDRYPGSGAPTHYSIIGDYFHLFLTPDAEYTMKMKYYKRGLTLEGSYGDSNNIENIWLKWAPDWLIGETGAVIAGEYIRDDKMAQMFMQQAMRGKQRVMHRDTGIREANLSRTMGDL